METSIWRAEGPLFPWKPRAALREDVPGGAAQGPEDSRRVAEMRPGPPGSERRMALRGAGR